MFNCSSPVFIRSNIEVDVLFSFVIGSISVILVRDMPMPNVSKSFSFFHTLVWMEDGLLHLLHCDQHSIYKNDPRIDTISSILHFDMLMIFNCQCKDFFLEVPVLMFHINGLEMHPTPNQALLKCSSFSIIFSFDGVAFSLSFPKSLFSQNIRWKSSLDCFWRTFEVDYLGRSLVNCFIAWNRSNLMRMFVPNIKAATFSTTSNS